MKGRIYEKDWTYDRELDRAIATAAVQSDGRDRGIDLGRADAAREQLEATVEAALRTMRSDIKTPAR